MRWILPEEFLATLVPLDAVDWVEAGEVTAHHDLATFQPVLGHRQPGDLHRPVVLTEAGGQAEGGESQAEHDVRRDQGKTDCTAGQTARLRGPCPDFPSHYLSPFIRNGLGDCGTGGVTDWDQIIWTILSYLSLDTETYNMKQIFVKSRYLINILFLGN